jgi:hypothetical protein
MVEKPKRMPQILDLTGQDITNSPWLAELEARRRKNLLEFIEAERVRLRAFFEGRDKKKNNGGEL